MKVLPEVMAFAAAASGEAGFEDVARLFVEVIIEELFTNTVVHGYGGDSSQPVWVSVADENGKLSLTYEDAAPPYDPLAPAAPDLGAPVEGRRVGGLGLPLVKALSESVTYDRHDDRNRLVLIISPRHQS
jgi:anti-sigma regulatory factor (Ser/Thr protein kinase)